VVGRDLSGGQGLKWLLPEGPHTGVRYTAHAELKFRDHLSLDSVRTASNLSEAHLISSRGQILLRM
jgi:hypothetical protein